MWPDEDGSWSTGDWDRNGYTSQNGPEVQSNSLMTMSTVSEGEDRWTGWFQSVLSTGINYAIQADAADRNLVRTRAPDGSYVYSDANRLTTQVVANNSNGLLLIIGAGVLLAVLLARKG